ncbi:CoA-binding protein [Mongoliimonas terrestris]|uniref:CoA-binding protein n=1 Tax=Mongoliimonas terrestris TaxID=1709001 RepID=UPI000949AECF|nr:CoA-binding protein [Mongoliimonas terrestris]
MTSDGKTDDEIRTILRETKTIALVGASNNPDRASYRVLGFLLGRGYTVHPVNPGLAGKTIHGATVVASLKDLPGPVDMVDVFRNSDAAGAVIDEALALEAKPKVVWLQLGVVNAEGAARGEAAAVSVVMDRCPAIEVPRLGM